MDEKLNIRSSFPMFKSPVKVKRLDKQNEELKDRSFDRHLKKDRDKRKKKHREEIHHHNIEANRHRKIISSDRGMNGSSRQNGSSKHIDVLA
jgi:hypothetical protein